MTKMEVKPLASLGHGHARTKSRLKKRTPTGSANRIAAPEVTITCPIDANGRYQSTFDDDKETRGWPLSAQISQAGRHIEFQIAPLLTAEQCRAVMKSAGVNVDDNARNFNKFIIFGGGDFRGADTFDIYFYENGARAYECTNVKVPDSHGTLTQIGKDEWKLELKGSGGPTRQLRAINILKRYYSGPTPFMQSLPGLVQRIRSSRRTRTETLTATMLWWPLHPWQKKQLRLEIPQIRANIHELLLTTEYEHFPDRMYNIEKRLALARKPWIELDAAAARLYLRTELGTESMEIDGITKPVLAFLDDAVRMYRTRVAGGEHREFPHPLDKKKRVFLLRRDPSMSYVPEVLHYVGGHIANFIYKATLNELEVGAEAGPVGIGSSAAGLKIEKFKVDDTGAEEHVDTYHLVLTLVGVGLGFGTPFAVTTGKDATTYATPYDWQGPDFNGLATLGEFGVTYTENFKGGTMSEETLIIFGNNDMIPYPLQFDFGDIGIDIKGEKGVEKTEPRIDKKYGIGSDAGFIGLIGWVESFAHERDKIIIDIEDAQMDATLEDDESLPGFDFGSALLNRRGLATLDVLVARERYALMHSFTRLVVAAHADLPDTSARNRELTDLRARNTVQAIKDRLRDDFRVDSSRVFALGLGDSEQLAAENFVDTNQESEEFRRADIEIDSRYVVALRAAGKASIRRG
ncbi:MAG: hypothetical protein AAF799_20150 [Myxococcota bacterium]